MLNKKRLFFIVLVLITMAILYVFSPHKVKVDDFVFEPSQDHNEGLPFNYWLVDKKNNRIISFFVNDFIFIGGDVYFTYINGELEDDFCYVEKDLKLGRINRKTGRIEYLPINQYQDIYNKINTLENRDKRWLSEDFFKCKGWKSEDFKYKVRLPSY